MLIKDITNPDYIRSIIRQSPYSLDNNTVSDGAYTVTGSYMGEIPFGPAYIGVGVSQNGREIWSGTTYGGDSSGNLLSEKYNKLILVKWFSLKKPDEQAVVAVDLTTGKEKHLTGKGRYYQAGHFYSFNMAYYSKFGIDDTICHDLETGETFLLSKLLKNDIRDIYNWGISPVPDTIIVMDKGATNNLHLYNIRSKKIVESISVDFKPLKKMFVRFFLDKENGSSLIQFRDHDHPDMNIQYKLIDFQL